MLPMFEPKKMASVISSKRGKPDLDVAVEVEIPGSEIDPGLQEAAEDIMRAIESKSVIDLAKAIKSAIECVDSAEEPSMEIDESYEE